MWRYFAIGVAVTSVLVAGPWIAGAEAPPGPAADGPVRTVEAASHVGRYGEGEMTWRSEFAVEGGRGRGSARVEFVRPLPESATLVETTPVDAEAIERRGRIVGLRIPASGASRRRVAIVVRQSLDAARGFRPPFAGPKARQRVALQDVRFEPDPDAALVEYPGYIAPEGYRPGERDRLQTAFAEPPPKTTQLIYLRPIQLDEPRLRGAVTPESTHKLQAVGLIGGAMVLLGLLGAVLYRWLEGRAKEEEAEEVLREHGVAVDDVL